MNSQAVLAGTILPEPFDVLVTGSSGHLGTALMLSLPEMGFNPVGMDILPSDNTTYVFNIANRDFMSDFVSENPRIKYIIHAASLHEPHMETHSDQDFMDSNIIGTRVLIDAAQRYCEASSKIEPFQALVYISTANLFGGVRRPPPGGLATWINESVSPIPGNICERTRATAESLCALGARRLRIPTVILRVSDFFPDADENARRANMADENLKVLELAYRRVDIADVVGACRCAMARARVLELAKYVISAPLPFERDEATLEDLNDWPQTVFEKVSPGVSELFERKGWKFLNRINRVYDSTRARRELGWVPRYTFIRAIDKIHVNEEWRSELALAVGNRGYPSAALEEYVLPIRPLLDLSLLEPTTP